MLRSARLSILLIAAAVLVGMGAMWAQPWPSAHQPSDGIRWQKLTAEQKAALQPLADEWPTLTGAQQRKWVTMTRNFQRLPPEEQAVLQSRMTDWSMLTPAQRTQARVNYGEARRLAATTERKARWEQYQELPSNERQRLAAARPKPPHGMAPALHPPRTKLARPARPGDPRRLPVNDNTLQPLPLSPDR